MPCGCGRKMIWFRLIGLLITAHAVAAQHHHHHSHQPVDEIDPPVYVAGALQWGPYDSAEQPAATVIADNLAGYTSYAQQAKQQGVQILVFNEGGLGMFNAESTNTRDAMLPYCESVPTPTYTSPHPNIRHFAATSNINPCTGMGGNFSINSQMYTISCLAQQLQMILVLNTCDVQTCSATTDPECPSDNRYQYNTQVVFNEHGDLIAKYHKSHLFGGSAVFNQAHPIAVTFSTYFNVTFGTFVCFDILYPEPATSLVKMGITHYVFSSWWDNFPPGFIATMQQQAWSRQHQVALIAANTGSSPTESGGGIYVAGEPLVSLFITDGPNAQNVRQLIVAKIPITFKRDVSSHVIPETYIPSHIIPPEIRDTTSMVSDDVYTICALGSVLAPTGNCSLITSPVAGNTYTLTSTSGTLTCSATITMENGVNETYGLFAYQGVINFPNTIDPLSLEVCGISQCANQGIILGYTVCEPLFTGNTIISSFTVTGTGFRSDTSLFPQLALDNAQVQDTNLTTFQDQMNTTRIAQITSSMSITKTMWTAAIFGVVPNPPKRV